MTPARNRHDGGQSTLVLSGPVDLDSISVLDLTTRRSIEIFTVTETDDGQVHLGIPDGEWPPGRRRFEVAHHPPN